MQSGDIRTGAGQRREAFSARCERALDLFNGKPQATECSLHGHLPLSCGTGAYPGAPGLYDLTPFDCESRHTALQSGVTSS
jgi:hypothetical protein